MRSQILTSHKIPLALQSKVKQELNNLLKRNVISLVNEPTEWVSQMAVVKRSNGDLRICINPQPLNAALQREHYKSPTVDDVLPKLNGVKFVLNGMYDEHTGTDEQSSKLITMITPHCRYKWNKLPFGLKVSSEIF